MISKYDQPDIPLAWEIMANIRKEGQTMEQKEGLRNFCVNIKPVMLKCKEGKPISKDEQQQIVQFYFEVVDYLSK